MELKTLRAPLILDGATGTELQKRGMPASGCGEQWILDHPDALIALQRGYVAAGAQAVYAPSFGASRLVLARHGLGERVAAYNRRLVALSREAVGEQAAVGGDLAPTGLAMGGVDEALFEKLYENYREQAAALEQAGVDFYAVETQMSLAEARATVMAVRSVSEKPILVSFTLDRRGRTLTGGDIRAALLSLQELDIDAFGLNCVGDLRLLTDTLRELSALTRLPLLAKPNAGFPTVTEGRNVYDLRPEALAALVAPLVACGALLLGGCCGTDAAHIAALKAAAGRAVPRPREGSAEGWLASEYALVNTRAGEIPVRELSPDDDFEDAAAAAAAAGAGLLKLRLRTGAEVAAVLESQLCVKTPLWVVIPDAALRARFRRGYHGRARIDEADGQ